MDSRVASLKTPEDCVKFEKNASDRDRDDLALEARHHALNLKTQEYSAELDADAEAITEVENECLKAIFAHERVLSDRNRRAKRASWTWQMVKKHGILPAIERVIGRPADAENYKALADMGLQDFAFESVVLRHKKLFTEEAVKNSEARLAEWGA